MRRLLMRRLIRILTVCLVKLFFIPITELCNKQGGCPNLVVCPNIPDFTLFDIIHFVSVCNYAKHAKSAFAAAMS